MPAIEGIDRQHVEDQQGPVNNADRLNERIDVGARLSPAQGVAQPPEHAQNGRQRHIHQRPRRDAPQGCAGPRRRRHIRHAAERPEHDLVGLPAHLPASQRMAKLMQQHDHEQREVLQHRPDHRRILARAEVDAIHRDQEPGPVQIHIDARKAEQAEGPLPCRCHRP